MMKSKMRVFCWFLSLFCATRTEGFAVRGPAMPLVVQLGASVRLPCSVDTPLPLHELEVEWMRGDSGTLVHLFQEGESRPETQSPAYSGRADFFSEDISKGNFSLLLRNVTTEDKGLYKCVVHTVHESNETEVTIDIERLVVTGADVPAFAYAGDDVVLNCSVDTHVPVKELEVEWIKTNGEILVLLFSEGENRPETQHERFRGRAEFFTEEIPQGNFSLKLRDVKTEDKGEFMCKVHTDGESVNATVWLRELGFAVGAPAMPLVVQLGASVTLPCSVDTPLPLHELEVQWMREDSVTLVHLFHEGQSRPESQSPAYSGRADFFSEEISKGNFSLLLRDVTSEDKGLYKCVVHTVHESNETEVKIDIERLVVTGADVPVFAYAGEDVILNCSVDTHVPLKELEVEWMKTDGEILVLLFAEGENRPESQHERFRGRAEFFSEEIPKGNFSLKLRDVKTEDKGEFMCKVHTDRESVRATVWLRELGFSSLHRWVLVLTIAAAAFAVLSCIPALRCIIEKGHHMSDILNNDESNSALLLYCLLISVPCILTSIAFAIWGYIEGSVGEAFVGSAINFMRIQILFWVIPPKDIWEDTRWEIFTYMALPLENLVITTGVNSVVLQTLFTYRAPDSEAKTLTGILFGIVLLSSFISLAVNSVSKGRRTCVVLLCHTFTISAEIAFLIFTHGSGYSSSELPALMCFMAVHFIMHATSLFRLTWWLPAVRHILVNMFGSAVLSVLNSVALATEVILKAEKGEQTVDLRLIVFPFEFFFLAFWLILQMCARC